MSQHSKQQRKELVKQWKAEQVTELRALMPMSPEQLHRLLDYLDETHTACDRTTKRTEIFLDAEQLDKNEVLPWLAEHGGYCDCEVLFNLDDLDRALQPAAPPVKPELRKKSSPRDLRTATGWDLAKLPAPWRIGNLYAADEPIQLQIGKKGGCTLTILEAAMPPGDQTADEYWSQLWYARTKLPARGPLRISHTILELPANFRSLVVQSPSWLPVYGWIIPDAGSWHLEFGTESTRVEGDVPQIAALVARLAGSPS